MRVPSLSFCGETLYRRLTEGNWVLGYREEGYTIRTYARCSGTSVPSVNTIGRARSGIEKTTWIVNTSDVVAWFLGKLRILWQKIDTKDVPSRPISSPVQCSIKTAWNGFSGIRANLSALDESKSISAWTARIKQASDNPPERGVSSTRPMIIRLIWSCSWPVTLERLMPVLWRRSLSHHLFCAAAKLTNEKFLTINPCYRYSARLLWNPSSKFIHWQFMT